MAQSKRFDPYKFTRSSKDRMRAIRQAQEFTAAMQYYGGIMSVTLIEEYGWTVERVTELVGKMNKRVEKERG